MKRDTNRRSEGHEEDEQEDRRVYGREDRSRGKGARRETLRRDEVRRVKLHTAA